MESEAGQASNDDFDAVTGRYDAVIYIGTSPNEEHETGKVIWQTPMAPKGYTGGAIWSSTPAVDPKRGMVYVTTGNNYATPREVAECQEGGKRDCLPIDDHIDSFVPLDRKTGAIKWAN